MDSAINKSEEVSNTHGRPDRWCSNEHNNANGLKAQEETAVKIGDCQIVHHNVKLSKIGDMATKSNCQTGKTPLSGAQGPRLQECRDSSQTVGDTATELPDMEVGIVNETAKKVDDKLEADDSKQELETSAAIGVDCCNYPLDTWM